MVNLTALDSLVEQHLLFEASCSRAFHDPETIKPSSGEPAIVAAQHLIRRHVLDGDIDKATSLCEAVCPDVIADPQIQLIVRIHKLTELLHKAETNPETRPVTDDAAQSARAGNRAISEALQYSQTLATFALSAFPEAYAEFTEAMFLFVEPEKVANQSFILGRRRFVADTLTSRVRQKKCAHGSNLSMLIRYLSLIYIQFRTPVITRDEPATPLHETLQQLLESDLPDDATAAPIQWRTETPANPRSVTSGISLEEKDVQVLPERLGISRQKALESLQAANGDVGNALRNELGRVIISHSTLRKLVTDYAAARGLDPLRIVPSTEFQAVSQNTEGFGYVPHVTKDGIHVAVVEQELPENFQTMWHAMNGIRAAVKSSGEKRESLPALRAALEHAGVLYKDVIRFKLAQREVAMYAEEGSLEQALDVLRSEMGPIVLKNPSIQSELEEMTMMVVCASKEHSIDDLEDTELQSHNPIVEDVRSRVWKACSLKRILHEVYDMLQQRYGEPELVLVIQCLLEAHTGWQEVSMLSDRCSAFFGIEELGRAVDEEGDGRNNSADKHSDRKGKPDGEEDSRMEVTILKLVEILDVSRAEAIALINSHPPTATPEVILEAVFSNRAF